MRHYAINANLHVRDYRCNLRNLRKAGDTGVSPPSATDPPTKVVVKTTKFTITVKNSCIKKTAKTLEISKY